MEWKAEVVCSTKCSGTTSTRFIFTKVGYFATEAQAERSAEYWACSFLDGLEELSERSEITKKEVSEVSCEP
jgi:hypothetical protein